jgi:hypothetical protein
MLQTQSANQEPARETIYITAPSTKLLCVKNNGGKEGGALCEYGVMMAGGTR